MVLHLLEFLIGGTASCCACMFSNPLEVVKIRMQLQGELKAKGCYKVHYKNVFHAFYTIGKVDGITALQKGLVPALWYQLFMNGIRLGVYESVDKHGFIRNESGNVSLPKSVLAASFAGCVGAFVGSPFYLVKTQLQSKATQTIAVGYQHDVHGVRQAFKHIYSEHGIKGLWRGVSASMPRVGMGSAAQLTSFSWIKQKLEHYQAFSSSNAWCNGLVAAMSTGFVVVAIMTPFDVASTRIYNQGTTGSGAGLYYSGIVDCFVKIFKAEGVWGFYKGWAASFFRIGPHSMLSLFFWDRLKFLSRQPFSKD